MSRSRTVRGVAVAVVAAVVAVLSGPSAASADPRISLSLDGRTYAPTLDAPLFDPEVRWVPGDRRVASFWVRNSSGDSATLTVDVLGRRTHDLLDTGDLTVSARSGGAWRGVDAAGTHRLVAATEDTAGGARRVDLAVSFDPASSNVSQVRRLDLAFRVGLEQAGPGRGDENADPSGLLPGTGSGVGPLALAAAAALLVTGTALLRRRRDSASALPPAADQTTPGERR